MNLYVHLKWLFKMLSTFFYSTSREERYSAYKMKVLHSQLENFRFHNKYNDEYEKVFIIFWTLQTNFCNFVHVEWFLGPCSKKVVAACHK